MCSLISISSFAQETPQAKDTASTIGTWI
jgi:hypothetical protein